MTEMMIKSGADMIADERRRQVEVEGWTPEHDLHHGPIPLANAASSYAAAMHAHAKPLEWWPWGQEAWKPKGRVFNLVRAGALYLAAAEVAEARPRPGNSVLAQPGYLRQCAKTCANQIDLLLAGLPAPTRREAPE